MAMPTEDCIITLINKMVSVTMKYWIDGSNTDGEPRHQKIFSQENVAPARIGLPEDVEPSKVSVDSCQQVDIGYLLCVILP